jgi:coatomer protein complex subunit epsilon
MLQLRARLALGQYDEVVSETTGESEPDLVAAGVAAEFLADPSESSPALEKAKELAETEGDNLGVQILCGTVLARAGEGEAALALLGKHDGSLDA